MIGNIIQRRAVVSGVQCITRSCSLTHRQSVQPGVSRQLVYSTVSVPVYDHSGKIQFWTVYCHTKVSLELLCTRLDQASSEVQISNHCLQLILQITDHSCIASVHPHFIPGFLRPRYSFSKHHLDRFKLSRFCTARLKIFCVEYFSMGRTPLKVPLPVRGPRLV